MILRLGYVAIALNLPKTTSSSTVTYATYSKLTNEESRINKLKSTTLSNLDDLYKILQYNVENQIHFYRITSALIPLATHPEVMWKYRDMFSKDFKRIGDLVRRQQMRVDTHPDEFNVINSVKEEVVVATERNLWPHVHLFEDIDYPEGKMVLHVGSSAGGKEEALERFKVNFRKFPKEITSRLMIENDDKTFNVKEVLSLCKELNAPMVLDAHHHLCNNDGEELKDFIFEIFDTWNGQSLPAKFHFSSPKESERDRKHADYIDAEAFVRFIDLCKDVNRDMDVMLEAKKKDLSLYKLADDIEELRPEWKRIDKSSFYIT
ncbi:UV DNA damage repair endonuclease UvsE [Clostridium manihotivorum]|uniref:UV DNA damage repair endonuclease UvsE n=1 Tax=Clostridium manihotivorum TaxID=2320868 RepID=A0A410DRX0_9CLOT|nr:UV DNA damage repair endonuclease UvsE [Clostridium manihotivorum]QAA31826.1 UV DNA damage repair endonuclease UvsE [Clostridium manihotivorum]